jgi:DNA-binding transcriptional MerR regulator
MSAEPQIQKTYSIGEVARMTGASTQSIRNWEHLLPALQKTPGGHRRYADAHVVAIKKLLGQPTSEVSNA